MSLQHRQSLEPWLYDTVEYYGHQLDGVRKLARMQNFILADDMGLGKANPYSEPILTPSGWTEMGKLSVGDQVIGASGQATDITHIFEQGVKDIVKITFNDKSWTRCTLDHLWAVNSPVRKLRGNSNLVMTAKEILSKGLKDAAGNNKWYIPIVEAVEFTATQTSVIDPYAMGVLLGDGSLSSHNASVTTDKEIVESMVLPLDVKAVWFKDIGDYTSGYRLNGLAKYLREYNLMGTKSETKFIPEEYKWGSIATRIAVLQGLVDTDGNAVQSRGKSSTTIEYGTVSKQLSEDVKHIVQSLGGLVSIAEKIPTYDYKGEHLKGQLFYRMVLRLPDWLVPFRLERKLQVWTPRTKYAPTRAIVSIEFDREEEARCIRVSAKDSLYVTRNFIVTHNSLQALTVSAIDVKRDWANKILIVAPVSLKGNWQDEIEKFTKFPCMILGQETDIRNPNKIKKLGPADRLKQLELFKKIAGPKILITNYEQVEPHLADFNKIGFDIGIFDEAHYMKNYKSKRTKSCLALNNGRSFLLTGTPMLNHVNELWPLLYKVAPAEFPKYWNFLQRYAVFGGYKDKQIIGVQNEKELTERLHFYMLRRMKKDVLDLPDVQYIQRKVDLLPEQRKIYDELIENLTIELSGQEELSEIENPLTKFLRLKQICGTTLPFTGKDNSAKLDLAVDDAAEILSMTQPDSTVSLNNKLVVFTQFRDVKEAFCSRLDKDWPSFDIWELDGDVPTQNRQGIVKEWSEHKGPGVIVCMLQVAGVGLNMTAARHAFFIDKLFVPGLNQQAVDRLHRIGADAVQPVQITEYICRNTIENRVEQILRTKKKLFGSIVDESDFKRKLIQALMAKEENDDAA